MVDEIHRYVPLGSMCVQLTLQIQQVAAGPVPPICRERLGAAYRRYHRESFLQGERSFIESVPVRSGLPSSVTGLISRVFTLHKHDPSSLIEILQNALSSLPEPIPRLPTDLLPFLADVSDGDARQALNSLELALNVCASPVQTSLTGTDDYGELAKRDEQLMDAVRKGLRKGYDRSGEERYDMISALHKCLRGSDGSAAMYWLAR
jgi:hypothetical protein